MYSTSIAAAGSAILLSIATLATASAIPADSQPVPHWITARDTTPVSQLLAIAPAASSCDGSSECATAAAAVTPLLTSFHQYGIVYAAEQAALISWMAYESGNFKYNRNHFPAPGRPGQGTRTMMSPAFVKEYALSIPALASQVAGKSDDDVLALVQPDQYSFASAAWFYSKHCSATVKSAVQSGSRAGWRSFLTDCVGTTPDEGSGDTSRVAYWQRAMAALYVNITN